MNKSSMNNTKKTLKNLQNTQLETINPISLELERITDSIQCLQQIIPQAMNKDLIKVIYQRFGTKFNLSQSECNKFIMQHDQKITVSKNTTKNEPMSHQELKALQQLQNRQNKIVARAFCLRDFGYTPLLKEIQQQCQTIRITEDNYEAIISRVIKEALETLQAYLAKQGMLHEKSSKQEYKAMIIRGIQCRKMLAPQICEIFFMIIRGLYEIEPIEFVTKQQANILYKTFKRIAHAATIDPFSKQAQKLPHQPLLRKQPQLGLSIKQKNVQDRKSIKKQFKFQIHEIWSSSHQQLFVQLYQRTPYLSMIRDKFKEIFCEHSQYFTVQSLKSVLFRMLRLAIKKLQQIIKQHQVHQFSPLTTLDDNRIKQIIYNERFREARILILQVYSKEYNLPLLIKTINKINLLISQAKNNYSTKRDKQKYNESKKKVRDLCREFQQNRGRENQFKDYNTWCPTKELQMKTNGQEFTRKSETSSELSVMELLPDNESEYLFYD